jgi:hypothetical protein
MGEGAQIGEQDVYGRIPSRSSDVLKAILGEDFSGKISCDFYGAYQKFAKMSSAELAGQLQRRSWLCPSLVKEITGWAQSGCRDNAGLMLVRRD